MSMLAGGSVLQGPGQGARQPMITKLVIRIDKAKNLMISPLPKAHTSLDLAHGRAAKLVAARREPAAPFLFHHEPSGALRKTWLREPTV
jgi:hypothetical protein